MNAKEFRAKLIKEEIEERFEHLKLMVDKATDEGIREYKVKGYITLEIDDSEEDREVYISKLSK